MKCDFELLSINMDNEKREQVHYNFAPCTEETFLNEYLKLDPDFEESAKLILDIESLDELYLPTLQLVQEIAELGYSYERAVEIIGIVLDAIGLYREDLAIEVIKREYFEDILTGLKMTMEEN